VTDVKSFPFFIFVLVTSSLLISCKPQTDSSSLASEAESASSPRQIYENHCSSCHGLQGDGNGPAAVWLFPKPRNFSSGLFKIQSTPAGSLPSDEDLFQTVTRGMPGSSMPSFTYLKEAERRAVVEHVKQLSTYTDGSGNKINRFEAAKNSPVASIEVPPEPPVTLEALNQGKQLFTKLGCATCHGENGAGDGPSAPMLKDNWGLPLPPRDFNTGAFRGGHTGKDLYLRIATGMPGTPMAAFGNDVMTSEERWALVLYIQSLRRKEVEINDILAPSDGSIHAKHLKQKLPSDPSDSVWETLDPVRVPLNPLWPVASPIPAVAVRAVHDGKKIALLLTWRDPSANGAPIRVQDFQDAVAIQFPLNGTIPFLGMGDSKNPVNIWQWKAGWQQEASGVRPDVDTTYQSMHTDMYPETKPLYRSAEAAGNLLAQPNHSSPIEDANARGFGTLKSQTKEQQNVKGTGVWRDGHWSVMFVREIKSRDAEDARFLAGKSTPIAFAVWDGQQRDRNGRKVISNWYQLLLEP
jgi:DMSO reductase family type II enzyme heme b subunit